MDVDTGRGNTLNVTSLRMPKRPRLPTRNFGTSKPGRILHNFAAHAEQPSGAIDELHAENKVAHAAEAEAARAARVRCDSAAEGRAGIGQRADRMAGTVLARPSAALISASGVPARAVR